MASVEKRMTATPEVVASTSAVNAPATATMPAVVGSRNYATMAIMSFNGAIAAAVRATLTWTKDGSAKTIGIQLPPATLGPVILNFGDHPLEGDDNTAITLSIPALGAAITGEATLMGFVNQV